MPNFAPPFGFPEYTNSAIGFSPSRPISVIELGTMGIDDFNIMVELSTYIIRDSGYVLEPLQKPVAPAGVEIDIGSWDERFTLYLILFFNEMIEGEWTQYYRYLELYDYSPEAILSVHSVQVDLRLGSSGAVAPQNAVAGGTLEACVSVSNASPVTSVPQNLSSLAGSLLTVRISNAIPITTIPQNVSAKVHSQKIAIASGNAQPPEFIPFDMSVVVHGVTIQ